jgi:hypothetical protein
MSMLKTLGLALFVIAIGFGGLSLSERILRPGAQSLVSTADARIGRPLTPVSVAGVARRTVRRCAVGVYRC